MQEYMIEHLPMLWEMTFWLSFYWAFVMFLVISLTEWFNLRLFSFYSLSISIIMFLIATAILWYWTQAWIDLDYIAYPLRVWWLIIFDILLTAKLIKELLWMHY